MVGLQWLLPEPGRQNLRRGSPDFRLGRTCDYVSDSAVTGQLSEKNPVPDLCSGLSDSDWCFPGGSELFEAVSE